MLFGLACEGVTDQITIENILCGYFDNPDLEDEVKYLQPTFDETDQKQKNFGGWEMLLAYLGKTDFRDDVLNRPEDRRAEYHQFAYVELEAAEAADERVGREDRRDAEPLPKAQTFLQFRYREQ